jgi:hypothetical protein
VDHQGLQEPLGLPEALAHQVLEVLLVLQDLAALLEQVALRGLLGLADHQEPLDLVDLLEHQALEVRLEQAGLLGHLDLAVLRDLLGPAGLLA